MMDTCLNVRRLFFNNLLILGFKKCEVEKKLQVVCDMNMFNLPNPKLFEVVTHFLFFKLNEVSSDKDQYKIPWPLLGKDQQRQFMKTSFTHLQDISQKSCVKFPRISLSMLSNMRGDRLYDLYLAFSTHIVKKAIEKNNNVSLLFKFGTPSHNFHDKAVVLKSENVLSVKKFKEIQKFSKDNFFFLLKLSNSLVSQYESVKLMMLKNKTMLTQKLEILNSLLLSPEKPANSILTLDDCAKKVLRDAKKVREDWQHLRDFFAKDKELWETVETLLDDASACVLNGADLKLNINSSSKSVFPKIRDYHTEDGQVDLLKYLQEFKVSLEFYVEHLLKGDVSEMEQLLSAEKKPCFDENITTLRKLNDKLKKFIAKIEANIKTLESIVLDGDSMQDLEISKSCLHWSQYCQNTLNDDIISRPPEYRTKLPEDRLKSGLIEILIDEIKTSKQLWGLDSPPNESSESGYGVGGESISTLGPGIPTAGGIDNDDSGLAGLDNALDSTDLSENTALQPVGIQLDRRLPALDISEDIFDLNYEFRKKTLRESWQQVESLDNVTMPDDFCVD